MEDKRRMSTPRKVALKMAAALASGDNRAQAALARFEAPENYNARIETVEINDDDDEASLDDDDDEEGLTATLTVHPFAVAGYTQKRHSKGTKLKTQRAKALEDARKAPRSFLELFHEVNLESLPPRVPSYLRAAVGTPNSTSRRQFCTICCFTVSVTFVKCGMRFCCIRCQNIHDDTRCRKFVA